MGGGGREGRCQTFFLFFFSNCSADHERDRPPCKVVFFGLATNSLNARNNNNNTTGDLKATALEAEVWVETVEDSVRRFMAAWRKEEVDAARHRQEKRKAARLGKLSSHTEA